MPKSDLQGLAEFDQLRRPKPETTIKTISMLDESLDGTVENLVFWQCSHCGDSGTGKPGETPKSCSTCDPEAYPGGRQGSDMKLDEFRRMLGGPPKAEIKIDGTSLGTLTGDEEFEHVAGLISRGTIDECAACPYCKDDGRLVRVFKCRAAKWRRIDPEDVRGRTPEIPIWCPAKVRPKLRAEWSGSPGDPDVRDDINDALNDALDELGEWNHAFKTALKYADTIDACEGCPCCKLGADGFVCKAGGDKSVEPLKADSVPEWCPVKNPAEVIIPAGVSASAVMSSLAPIGADLGDVFAGLAREASKAAPIVREMVDAFAGVAKYAPSPGSVWPIVPGLVSGPFVGESMVKWESTGATLAVKIDDGREIEFELPDAGDLAIADINMIDRLEKAKGTTFRGEEELARFLGLRLVNPVAPPDHFRCRSVIVGDEPVPTHPPIGAEHVTGVDIRVGKDGKVELVDTTEEETLRVLVGLVGSAIRECADCPRHGIDHQRLARCNYVEPGRIITKKFDFPSWCPVMKEYSRIAAKR